jgi:hypothetical protein
MRIPQSGAAQLLGPRWNFETASNRDCHIPPMVLFRRLFFSLNEIQTFYKSAKRILDIITGSLPFYLGGRLKLGRA